MRRSLAISTGALTFALGTACVTLAPPTTTLPSTVPGASATPIAADTPQPTATVQPRATQQPIAPPATTSAPSAAPSATPGASAGELVAWQPCSSELECATLDVPIDYEDPNGDTLGLALIRHAATNPNVRIGSLVMNPGGPGGSGVDWVRNAWFSFGPALTDRFDIVGFDPRGIGQSEAVRCLDTRPQLTDAFPENAIEEQAFIELARSVVEACERNNDDLLPFVGTDNVARDLDQLRAALGDEKLTYFGFSYGTFIGATYADMFPGNIRALVLDGPVDPTLDLGTFIDTQSAASQAELDEFLDQCSDQSSCDFNSGGQPRQAFERLMNRFDRAPIDGVTSSVALAAIYQQLVLGDDAGLATMLSLADDGVTAPMAGAGFWATDARALDGYDAVNCADYATPRTPEGFAELADRAAEVAPDIGAWNTYTYFACAFWPFESERVPGPVGASGAPPILVIASTGDPSTPYEWGVSLADQLESGILVTRAGDGHTSFHFSGCIRQIATTYLATLATPADGTTCS
jgi:pimeloyl-ACP methyl ester carboxylesterase